MNKMKIMMVVATATLMIGGSAYARGHRGGSRGGFGGRGTTVINVGGHGHGHHSRSSWGRGGRNFWPGFVGGVIGGALTDAVIGPRPYVRPRTVVVDRPVYVNPAPIVTPAPVVVQQQVVTPAPVVVQPQPVYTTQNVWVEGRYVDRVQGNGAVIRVWEPGHYEQRQIQVQ